MPPQYLFSAFFLVGFMTIGILIGFLPQVRNRYKARPLTPGQVPSPRSQLRGEGWRTANFVGELHFKSASAKAGIICGVVLATCAVMGGVAVLAAPISGQAAPPLRVAVPAIAAPLVLIAYSYFRPKRAAQSLYVDQNRAITLIRGDVRIPFDLNHFRYVRMDSSTTEVVGLGVRAVMLVMYRDTPPSIFTRWSSVLWPRCDDGRVVVFFQSWRDSEGYLLGAYDIAGLFYQACVRAGRTPKTLDHFFRQPSWEVRPDSE